MSVLPGGVHGSRPALEVDNVGHERPSVGSFVCRSMHLREGIRLNVQAWQPVRHPRMLVIRSDVIIEECQAILRSGAWQDLAHPFS